MWAVNKRSHRKHAGVTGSLQNAVAHEVRQKICLRPCVIKIWLRNPLGYGIGRELRECVISQDEALNIGVPVKPDSVVVTS